MVDADSNCSVTLPSFRDLQPSTFVGVTVIDPVKAASIT
jgi:hypothetical protein